LLCRCTPLHCAYRRVGGENLQCFILLEACCLTVCLMLDHG
jgi:hypothetical protein